MRLNPLGYVKGLVHSRKAEAAKNNLLIGSNAPVIDGEDFAASLSDPTAFYEQAFIDFHRQTPQAVRDHRHYFSQEKRGFGEDAFHTMWWRLFKRFKPESFLEIGVYRGQVVSLVAQLAKIEGRSCEITGISPFSSAGDSVSEYLRDLDYHSDTLANFKNLGLPEPNLLKAYSTDPEAVELIGSRQWDAIYIDGNHDYEIVLKDWDACSKSIRPGGIIVLDDSGLSTSYQPPAFATGGHPGPSKLAGEIKGDDFTEILQVGHNRVFRHRA